jgi:hypothetical protein
MFLNLSQTEGPEVAVSVRTFVERYDALSQPEGPYGSEGAKAKELLQVRGLTTAVIDEARTQLEALGKVSSKATALSTEESKADLQRAEDTLWAWYLEWIQVARTAIKQRVLLRQLGFLSDRISGDEEEPSVPPSTQATTTAPA